MQDSIAGRAPAGTVVCVRRRFPTPHWRRSSTSLALPSCASLLFPVLALAQTPQDLDAIEGSFRALHMAVYVAVVLGLAAGGAVFLYRRRRLMRHSVLSGASVATLSAIVAFWLLSFALTSPLSSRCASDLLKTGSNAKPYDIGCAESRERPANALGLVSLLRSVDSVQRQSEVKPLGTAAVRSLPFLSVALAALLGFLLVRPLLQWLWVRA